MKTIKLFAAAAILASMVACTSTQAGAQTEGDDTASEAPLKAKDILPKKAVIDSVRATLWVSTSEVL